MKKLFLSLSLFFAAVCGFAQDTRVIRIGQRMPDATLDIQYVNAGVHSLADLKGKPLVIDFFSKGCTACFASFPKVNEFYASLQDKVNIILVGIDTHDGVRAGYEKFQKRYNLNLPVAYDTVLYKQYGIRAVPHVIWIDAQGIVQAVTGSLDKAYLIPFSDGKPFAFIDLSQEGKEKMSSFDKQRPFLVDGNGGSSEDFIQRSLVSKWKPGMPSYVPDDLFPKTCFDGLNSFQALGRSLEDLYRIAFFKRSLNWYVDDTVAYGNYHYGVVLNLDDRSQFEADYNLGRNLFCYSLIRPEGGQPLHEIMQQDLENMFGYEAHVEVRNFPYLALVAMPGAAERLKVNPKKLTNQGDMTNGGEFNNIRVDVLISLIVHPCKLVLRDLPLLNETGMKGNIAIKLDAIMTDLEDVKRALRKSGLDIVQKEKEMKVIVVSEKGRS